MLNQLIECVPNFSEGRNEDTINAIANAVKSVAGVKLLNVDPGKTTNRTVFTIVGQPEQVIDAAFQAIKVASELIDMQAHSGEHPRMGATDVCPLIPIANISMAETVQYAEKLAERVGRELNIPIYLYEEAAKSEQRRNLAIIREGEYEGFGRKIQLAEWKPDYGPSVLNLRSGATVIGARDFLVAYNVNLNTRSTRIANAIAFDVREQGRVKRIGHPITGEIETDANGEAVRTPGTLKAVKAIGWYIEEYGQAQISMNLTNINITKVHTAFDEVSDKATAKGVRVTGSEIVGMVPKKVLTDAGIHYLKKQNRSLGVSEKELIEIAILTLGLNDISSFNPQERIIEFMLAADSETPLVNMQLNSFASLTASESPAPGGGSIAAYVGSLGAALGCMVSNLSANKRGWENQLEYFSEFGLKAQNIMNQLLALVDEDTKAFNAVMDSFGLPKTNEEETAVRKSEIDKANLYAAKVPLQVMQASANAWPMLYAMVERGNPNSVTDAGVGALCIRTAIHGAYLNLKVNVSSLHGEEKDALVATAEIIINNAIQSEQEILTIVNQKIS